MWLCYVVVGVVDIGFVVEGKDQTCRQEIFVGVVAAVVAVVVASSVVVSVVGIPRDHSIEHSNPPVGTLLAP